MELWLTPLPMPVLAEGDVHVWRADLNCTEAALETYASLLTADELARAARFRFDRDRRRFVAARGALRVTLSRYLQLAPEQICFAYNAYGKPALSAVFDDSRLRFNVSHAHELALYAVTRGCEVGVDVEFTNTAFNSNGGSDRAGDVCLELAEQFFAPVEAATLRALPEAMRTQAFFNCWTRKEAYIKAVGQGLSHPLDSFAVSLIPGEAARLSGTDGDHEPYAPWSLIELQPGNGYVAALAVAGSVSELRCWTTS